MNGRNEELLSAYLDGELSGEEQARVEQLLAGDESFRALHEEVRSLRADFEALPRYRAPEGFAEQVLQRAIRESTANTALAEGPDQSAAVELPQQGSISMNGRSRWIWPLIAAAAAVLILLFNPGDDEQLAVRDAREASEPIAKHPGARPAPTMDAAPESVAEGVVAMDAKRQESEERLANRDLEETADKKVRVARDSLAVNRSEDQNGDAFATKAASATVQQAESAAGEGVAGGDGAARGADKQFGEQLPGGITQQQPSAPAPAAPQGGGFGRGPGQGELAKTDRPAGEKQELKSGLTAGGSGVGNQDWHRLDSRETLFVTVTVTSEVARARLIEQLLEQQGARITAPPATDPAALERQLSGQPLRGNGPMPQAEADAIGLQFDGFSGRGALHGQESLGAAAPADAAPAESFRGRAPQQVLLVEATRDQLELAVLELADHPDKVLQLEVGGDLATLQARRKGLSDRQAEPGKAKDDVDESKSAARQVQQLAPAEAEPNGGGQSAFALRDERRRSAQRDLSDYFSRDRSLPANQIKKNLQQAEAETAQAAASLPGNGRAADAPRAGLADDAAASDPGSKLQGEGKAASPNGVAEADSFTHTTPPERVQAMFIIRVADEQPLVRESPAAGDPAALEQPASQQ